MFKAKISKIQFEYKIALVYFTIGFLWIFLSDTIVALFTDNIKISTKLSIFKGIMYVFITSVLLFYLVKNHVKKLKIAKEKAEESDKLKTAFIQNISHEIRTPMNAICGFAELLDFPDITEEKRKHFIDIIKNSSNQLLSTVNNILTISAIETNQETIDVQSVNLNLVLDDLLKHFQQQATEKKIKLLQAKGLTDSQANINTDENKLYIILKNLLSNALKFTISGQIEFGYSPKSNAVEFFVKDTGIGIEKDMHEKVFDNFLQASETIQVEYGGLGLGLSIAKSFVVLLGGKIWVESQLQKGSTFYFTIPNKKIIE